LRGAGDRVLHGAILGEDARLEERLDQRQDPLVPDPSSQPTQQAGMRDLVEARRDVSLNHPLIGAAGE